MHKNLYILGYQVSILVFYITFLKSSVSSETEIGINIKAKPFP